MSGKASSALFEALTLGASSSSVPTKMPAFLYGCAWKKEYTDRLVYEAISAGFKGIDVAAQPRHYREDLAGAGLQLTSSVSSFVQTKFSPVGAHDPKNIPYDPTQPISVQVNTSIASSLHNLRQSEDPAETSSTYIDSILLHSPLRTIEETLEAWRACEAYVPKKIKYLGISNVTLPQLQALYDSALVKPSFVQNRFHRETLYEVKLRQWCAQRGIVYQSFWTLTANPRLLDSKPVLNLAAEASVEESVALYCLVLGLGNTIIMNGTQNHMEQDLEGLELVRQWAVDNPSLWENLLKQFKDLTGDDNLDLSPTAGDGANRGAE
ncbi:hypothetical protein FH972_026071 [Carpinus fangiana]|uniref:NADP-dependent oxidoreductase domain-containing protein n=1 Tax=Carpinus fangiana TaxID=176857 RepID=A0A5N6L2W0_9ROSI|nr:hypothetical protein FH972_026071 [Carpinus fangiana]